MNERRIYTDSTKTRLSGILKSSLVSVVISFLSVSILVHKVDAQATNTQGFTAIPPRLELNVNPGESTKKIVQFRNEGDETVYISIVMKDFVVNTPNGKPEFVSAAVSGRWAASSWVQISPETVAVPPKGTINVTLQISTPKDALPGGHYAAVLYQADSSAPRLGRGLGAASAITQVIGTLVYLTVSGPVNEEAFIKTFSAPNFQEYGPVAFTSELLNQSDFHLRPKGQITIRDITGNVKAVLPLDEKNIFPGSYVTYLNDWTEKYLAGRFRADLSVIYGGGRTLNATLYFWIFPWKIVSVAILTVILLILLILLVSRQLRRRQELLESELEEERDEIEKLKEQLAEKRK